jgi:hypothetical protein
MVATAHKRHGADAVYELDAADASAPLSPVDVWDTASR